MFLPLASVKRKRISGAFLVILFMVKETEQMVARITEAIQDKKGRGIVIADLSDIDGAICPCFVIGEGNTSRQVEAIAEWIGERLRIDMQCKPVACEGLRNARWVAMDYVDVMVHVFIPEDRAFYNLESLWADAKLQYVPDLD